MKKDIHPKYQDAKIICACGEVIETRSTKPEIRVEICSKCHPFYTGKQKLVDTGGSTGVSIWASKRTALCGSTQCLNMELMMGRCKVVLHRSVFCCSIHNKTRRGKGLRQCRRNIPH